MRDLNMSNWEERGGVNSQLINSYPLQPAVFVSRSESRREVACTHTHTHLSQMKEGANIDCLVAQLHRVISQSLTLLSFLSLLQKPAIIAHFYTIGGETDGFSH